MNDYSALDEIIADLAKTVDLLADIKEDLINLNDELDAMYEHLNEDN